MRLKTSHMLEFDNEDRKNPAPRSQISRFTQAKVKRLLPPLRSACLRLPRVCGYTVYRGGASLAATILFTYNSFNRNVYRRRRVRTG